MSSLPATLLCDFYKVSHREMYPEKTQVVYSTWTPRASRVEGVNSVVVLGHQAFIKEWLVDFFDNNFFKRSKEEVVHEYERVLKYSLGITNPDSSHIQDLHDLGYLPLLIKGLPEGTIAPIKVPTLTIQNTNPKFFWLTNYIETLASCELWPMYTSATLANEYRKILEEAAMRTVGNTEFVQFQGHDFSMRGMEGVYGAVKTGIGHLSSFSGTDTIPAILAAEKYYNANIEKELVGTSIPATEHSIQCAYGNDMEYLETLITKVHPNGFVSIVSDGYDFWDVIGRVLPALKDKIMARSGGPLGDRVVIRPDSGDPVKIVCGDPDGKTSLERKGAVEALWDIFGGTTSPQGFKVLDSHIGLIYGDAITLSRAKEIVTRLEKKGFASTNIVFGIGSFTYQYNTRDTFGFALKSTAVVINEQEKHIFKNPKTDDGTKKSQKGRVAVLMGNKGMYLKDELSLNDNIEDDLLETIYEDGVLTKETSLAEVRARIRKG